MDKSVASYHVAREADCTKATGDRRLECLELPPAVRVTETIGEITVSANSPHPES